MPERNWGDIERIGKLEAQVEILNAALKETQNALAVAWPLVKCHGDEHEIVTVKDARREPHHTHITRDIKPLGECPGCDYEIHWPAERKT